LDCAGRGFRFSVGGGGAKIAAIAGSGPDPAGIGPETVRSFPEAFPLTRVRQEWKSAPDASPDVNSTRSP